MGIKERLEQFEEEKRQRIAEEERRRREEKLSRERRVEKMQERDTRILRDLGVDDLLFEIDSSFLHGRGRLTRTELGGLRLEWGKDYDSYIKVDVDYEWEEPCGGPFSASANNKTREVIKVNWTSIPLEKANKDSVETAIARAYLDPGSHAGDKRAREDEERGFLNQFNT